MINPLCIDTLRLLDGGRIGLTSCPGRFRLFGQMAFEVDGVAQDLARLRHWGARAVVTLAETDELVVMAVTDLASLTASAGLEWFHCPMNDAPRGVDTVFEQAWQRHQAAIHARLTAGEAVIVHCVSGYGRCGMILARLLIERGIAPEQALALTNAVRPGAIQNARQADYIRSAAWRPPLAVPVATAPA